MLYYIYFLYCILCAQYIAKIHQAYPNQIHQDHSILYKLNFYFFITHIFFIRHENISIEKCEFMVQEKKQITFHRLFTLNLNYNFLNSFTLLITYQYTNMTLSFLTYYFEFNCILFARIAFIFLTIHLFSLFFQKHLMYFDFDL